MASLGQYKKSYDGDYSKSYRDYAAWKKEGAEKKRIYDEISKKVGTKYNRSERSDYYDITGNLPKDSERVFADGRRSKKEDHGKAKRNWEQPYQQEEHKKYQLKKQEDVKSTTPAKTIDDIVKDLKESAYQHREQLKKENTYQPRELPKKEAPAPRVKPVEIEDDGNYNYIDYPIQQTGINSYKNLKTGKSLNAEEARKILNIAGFAPKSKASLGTVIFGFIIIYIIFPMIAPIAAIAYGVYRFTMQTTTWTKFTARKTLQFNMEATAEDIAFN